MNYDIEKNEVLVVARYATTDLHGRYDLYLEIKKLLRPEDIVYVLGDVVDRGPDSWKLMWAIYNDPQFVYIKGNHENMFVQLARTYLNNGDFYPPLYRSVVKNGGFQTIETWFDEGCSKELVDKIDCLPTHIEVPNKNGHLILLSHSGYTPWKSLDDASIPMLPSDDELLFNRDHYYDGQYEDWVENCVIVHGHTPITYLARDLNDPRKELDVAPYWYDGGRKVCLDVISWVNGAACLMDLDTFDFYVVCALEMTSANT